MYHANYLWLSWKNCCLFDTSALEIMGKMLSHTAVNFYGRNHIENVDSNAMNMHADRGGTRAVVRARVYVPGTSGTKGFTPKKPALMESLADLRKKTAAESGASLSKLSIQNALKSRELGSSRGRPGVRREFSEQNALGTFTLAEKAELVNRFLPNQRHTVDRSSTKIFCCLYLPNERLVTASQDEKLRFYVRQSDHYKLIKIHSVPEVGWSILDLALSSKGNKIAYATWNSSVYYCRIDEMEGDLCWNTCSETGSSSPQSGRRSRSAYFSVCYTMDDQHLIAGGLDGFIHISNDMETFRKFQGHHDDVNAIRCGETTVHLFFSGSDDGLCKVWDLRLPRNGPVGVFAGHRDGITFIDDHGDDKYILTNSKDQTIKLWDLRRFSSRSAERVTIDTVRKRRWDYRYQHVPSFFRSAGPLEVDGSVLTLRGHSVQHTLIRAKFSPERTGRRYVYTGCTMGNVKIYDILTGEIVRTLTGHKSVVRDCCWHDSDNEIISVSWDGVTARWCYDGRLEDDADDFIIDELPENEDDRGRWLARW